MRFVVIALGVWGVLLAAAQPGRAASRPWCIQDGAYGRGTLDCTYHNLQQCRASASGAGGHCIQNPALMYEHRGEPAPRRVPRGGY
jgi:hypothetical protein